MLTVFNRRELLTVLSLQQLSDIRQKLDGARIPHIVRTPASARGGRGRGMAENYEYEYRFYVHKDDYERAAAAVGMAL